MRIAIAYYFLLFYLVAFFKPVLPVVQDFFAHTFAPEHHQSTVHKENGNNHVHLQMASAAEQEDGQDLAKIKFSEPVSVHIVSQYAYYFSSALKPAQVYSAYRRKPANPFLYIIVPPPRLS